MQWNQKRPPDERLREHVLPIFQKELRCWCEDPSLWPQPLTLELIAEQSGADQTARSVTHNTDR